jgi:hypothetical protein
MADYFLVHDRTIFEHVLRPALTAAWTQRSFTPCRDLCRDWTPAARDYARRYHVHAEDILLFQVEHGLLFDRAMWRDLAGEMLLLAAVEIPEIPRSVDMILHLLDPSSSEDVPRSRQSPIRQALYGSRDLTFGPAHYRPEHAGYSSAADVVRLSAYLASIRADNWMPADLPLIADLEDEADREFEIAFAREWLAVLAELYQRSAEAGRVMVLEDAG